MFGQMISKECLLAFCCILFANGTSSRREMQQTRKIINQHLRKYLNGMNTGPTLAEAQYKALHLWLHIGLWRFLQCSLQFLQCRCLGGWIQQTLSQDESQHFWIRLFAFLRIDNHHTIWPQPVTVIAQEEFSRSRWASQGVYRCLKSYR